MNEPIIVAGETAWRTAEADRLAVIIDGEAYFAAFFDALQRARRSVLILSWDINSRVRLLRDGVHEVPVTLAAFLDAMLERRPELHIHILSWSPSLPYAFEREKLPLLRMGWSTHPRLHFHLDTRYPPGGSLHQKVVVIDDQIAFEGGLDLTSHRWDTPEHLPEDRRRVTPAGELYRPFHDVQLLVGGEAARALGDLARDRWYRATGEVIPAPAPDGGDPWPASVPVELVRVPVGIVRTEPAFEEFEAVGETARLLARMIAAARRLIFMEAQYLTSHFVADALAVRLAEPDPPEVVVVTARENEGWLEQATVGMLRTRLVHRLKQVDACDRLRVYYPVSSGVAPNVHSKVVIVDDEAAYIGSANLTNRSLTIDHECGVAIEAGLREDVGAWLASVRNRLLGEHLGVVPSRIDAERRQRGSLIAALEALRGGDRTLEPLEIGLFDASESPGPMAAFADAEQPISLSFLFEQFFGNGEASLHE